MRFAFLLILLFSLFSTASFSLAEEKINNFEVQYFLSADGTVRVEENIEYQFTDTYRHGIFRKIPWRYRINGSNYNIDIDVSRVTDFSDNSYKYEVSWDGGYLNIRIGDPDILITGVHGYSIEYFVDRSVLFDDEKDIFYWNVTGNEWKVPIMKSSARIYLENPGLEKTNVKCFTGEYGSERSDCTISKTGEGIRVESSRELWGGDGLTVRLELPKGVINEPSVIEKIYYFVRDNKSYSFPFITLAVLGLIWNYRGRDPLRGRSIAVRYSPPENMTPAEAGVLYDERADIIDLTSTIIDLAVRGYLRIEEIESTKFLFLTDRDYRIVKLEGKDTGELKDFELKILNGLFAAGRTEVMVSDLKNKFYKNLNGIRKSLYGSLVSSNYFISNPDRIRRIFKIAGFVVIGLGIILFSDIVTKLMIFISGILIIIFSRFMPRKTRRGAETNHHITGFREFIDRAEKERVKALSSDDPTLFERMLPFALVFGLEEKWAQAFSDIFTKPPDWYVSSGYGGTFNSHMFVNDLGRSIGVLNKSLYSSPKNSSGGRSISMSGGGFSGGGFGGGGGGSW